VSDRPLEPDDAAAERPDPVVARALRDLPVPEHRLTFWADLDAAVRAEAAAGAAGATTGAAAAAAASQADVPTRVPTGEVPVLRHGTPRPSLARRAAPWLAAVAGLVVVGATAGFVLSSGDDDGDGDLAGPADTTTAVPADTAPEPVPDTTAAPAATTSTSVPAEGDPAEVARAFIDALGAGETEVALSHLGPRSVAYIESLGGDPLGFVTELQEGYGSWAGAPDLAISSTPAGVVPPLESELAIVTVQGTNPGEGDPADRVDAFPMVLEGDRWVVELVAFADGRDNRLRFTLPASDGSGRLGSMQPADEINVFVPTAGTVLFQIDGGEVRSDETADIPAGVFSLHAPPEPLAAGEHVLVAVAVGRDGTIVGFGSTFTVEG
jgi:hypothetical protein